MDKTSFCVKSKNYKNKDQTHQDKSGVKPFKSKLVEELVEDTTSKKTVFDLERDMHSAEYNPGNNYQPSNDFINNGIGDRSLYIESYSSHADLVFDIIEKATHFIISKTEKGITETIISVNMTDNPFNSSELIVSQYDSSPKSLRIELLSNPQAIKLFNNELPELRQKLETHPMLKEYSFDIRPARLNDLKFEKVYATKLSYEASKFDLPKNGRLKEKKSS